MKQSFARQNSRHRNQTPSVIYLPPPKPPVAEARATSDAPKSAMTPAPERGPSPSSQPSRQARRQAKREEAKALRRKGVATSVRPRSPEAAEALATVAEAIATSPAIAPAAPETREAALPRERSLVVAKPGGLALFARRLRAWFGFRPPAPAQNGAVADQLRAVRAELAALQRSVDRIIEGVAA